MDIVLLLVALLGHSLIWIGYVNRVHATSLSRSLIINLTWMGLAATILIPVGFGVSFFLLGIKPWARIEWLVLPWPALVYLIVCWFAVVVGMVLWVWGRATHRRVSVLRFDRRRIVRLNQRSPDSSNSDDHTHHFLAHLPGNQILQIDCAERGLEVARLDSRLEGLSIIHLSDLHFTGRVGKAYFQEVVHLSNELEPDLVAVTGDLVDSEECIDWVPDVFGLLRAKYGVYYVLGNHDLRVDTRRLRRALSEAGLINLGSRWTQCEINGASILLAGNELPWFAPAADMTAAPPRDSDGGPLRILLAHSPDQLDWAIAQDFDLMMAGHLHGGQIRLPLIGPILAPSRQGVRFASGVFHDAPTILHVSRGVSAELPVRFNCPPELTKLILHAKPKPGL